MDSSLIEEIKNLFLVKLDSVFNYIEMLVQGNWEYLVENWATFLGSWLFLSVFTGIILPILTAIIAAAKGKKSYFTAYFLWFHWWPIGIHRFYLEKIGTGILWFFTGGLFGIGGLLDIFLTGVNVREYNRTSLNVRENIE